MGKILHVRNWKKEKGISLVELVISLTIIVIISIAGVSIAVYSSNSFKNNELKRHFVSELTSLSILYINSTNFVSVVNSFYGDSVLNDEIDTDVYFDANYKVIHSTSEFAYRLYFDFETDKLTLSSYTQSDKLIYSKEVSK